MNVLRFGFFESDEFEPELATLSRVVECHAEERNVAPVKDRLNLIPHGVRVPESQWRT